MIVGIAKPSSGIVGGYEFLNARIAEGLRAFGHDVVWLMPQPAGNALGGPPESIRAKAREYFSYVEEMRAFRALTPGADVLLSTQPPSQAIEGLPQVALFYHHHRIYYDLSDLWIRAGFAHPEDHLVCQRAVRRIDAPMYANVSMFLAGSDTVLQRIRSYQGSDTAARTLRAPPIRPIPSRIEPGEADRVLCVSRHEFPKRTELVVAAMKLANDLRADMVGAGGRLGWVMAEDSRWTRLGATAMHDVDAESIWLRVHHWTPDVAPDPLSNVTFSWDVSDRDLDRMYDRAAVVVAPAYGEDYGLTALEAMAHGKPVIVCADGGGLVETVELSQAGIVVEPDHRQIAAAVRRLVEDRGLAATLGERGRHYVSELSWPRYLAEVESALEAQL